MAASALLGYSWLKRRRKTLGSSRISSYKKQKDFLDNKTIFDVTPKLNKGIFFFLRLVMEQNLKPWHSLFTSC